MGWAEAGTNSYFLVFDAEWQTQHPCGGRPGQGGFLLERRLKAAL